MKQGNSLCLLAAGSFQHPRNWPQTQLNPCWEHLGSGSSGAVFPMRCPWLCYEEEPNYPKARSMLFYSRLDLFPRRTSGCGILHKGGIQLFSTERQQPPHPCVLTTSPRASDQLRNSTFLVWELPCQASELKAGRNSWGQHLPPATGLPAPGASVHQQPSQACPAHPPFGVPLRRL